MTLWKDKSEEREGRRAIGFPFFHSNLSKNNSHVDLTNNNKRGSLLRQKHNASHFFIFINEDTTEPQKVCKLIINKQASFFFECS